MGAVVMVMRRFDRHTSGMPLEFSLGLEEHVHHEQLRNISSGGACVASACAVTPGSQIHLTIPMEELPFEGDGMVVWCRRRGGAFDIGVQFFEATRAYADTVVQELTLIEGYRHYLEEQQGQHLSSKEAAIAWFHEQVTNISLSSEQLH